MKDTWTHIIGALSPDYETFRGIMANGPKVRCEIISSLIPGRTKIQLSEYWEWDKDNLEIAEKTDKFDDYVFWTEEQLRTWKLVRRTAWDQWTFKNLKDAEKFQTLFNLRWAK